jgi:hypothetical protein
LPRAQKIDLSGRKSWYQNNETGFVPKTAEISPRHSGAFHVAPYQFIGVQFGRIAGKMQRQRTFVDAA